MDSAERALKVAYECQHRIEKELPMIFACVPCITQALSAVREEDCMAMCVFCCSDIPVEQHEYEYFKWWHPSISRVCDAAAIRSLSGKEGK